MRHTCGRHTKTRDCSLVVHVGVALAAQEWRKPKGEPPRGFRSCVVYVELANIPEGPSKFHWITVGPTGSEWSNDAEHWHPLSDDPYHAVQVAPDGSIWACGPMGRVAIYNAH